jgi:uncharacterized repeat protein (TIGR03803 family)
MLIGATISAGQSESVIHVFGGSGDGSGPTGNLIADSQGALYGTTGAGGISCSENSGGCGVMFKLTPPSTVGGQWTESILYMFTGQNDGGVPGDFLFTSTGKIYGATAFGGAYFNGVVYELTPGNPWTETVIHAFNGGGGSIPGGLSFYKGRIIGTAANGGLNHSGVVFELVPPAHAGGTWKEKVLHNFDSNSDGCCPGKVIAGSDGALYGTIGNGGAGKVGSIYKLTPAGSGSWNLTTLYALGGGADGFFPQGVVFGSDGALYGAANGGDPACQCGVIFKLSPPSGSGAWTYSVLYTFKGGTDGSAPQGGVKFDSAGALYGSTYGGGNLSCGMSGFGGCGVVFKLTPPSTVGGSWTQSVVYTFQGGSDGIAPYGPPLQLNGILYGTTIYGGNKSEPGTVFEVAP